MSVAEKIVEKLKFLIESEELPADSQQPWKVETQEGPIAIEAHVLDFNRIGCSFTEMTVRGTEPIEEVPSVRARAEQVVNAVNYLMERLGLVEVDEASGQAQLRSTPPRHQNGATDYYEAYLRIKAGSLPQIHLARYRQEADAERRRTIPLDLTREALKHLLDDLAWILSPEPVTPE